MFRTLARPISVRYYSTNPFRVFDSQTKNLQRTRAALNPESRQVEYLRNIVAERTIERLAFITRDFNNVLDYGAHAGNLENQLCSVGEAVGDEAAQLNRDRITVRDRLKHIVMADTCREFLFRDASPEFSFNTKLSIDRVVVPSHENELLTSTFAPNSFDAVVLNLHLHWINDLPGVLKSINDVLVPDGLFMGTMLGGDTLFELRTSLQLAELERRGGMSPRMSPMVDVKDVGGLMNKAKFNMLTVDVEDVVVDYPSIVALMEDLQLMGENNATFARTNYMQKDLLIAANEIYKSLHGDEHGNLPATFRIIFMIGWKESLAQPKPLARGSAEMNLKDAFSAAEMS
ncbi:hypothetical protein BABINDRAFT_40166 [Babjeviella inositovora NRRL Y-12698]|uniref:Methyltransferase type 11 domain-containing protein n=1 Tax=Babjeviella inositovora NRRL Y-12698 TaxID=984486 RepID=A0A1E3QK78_9ASCO|nr:uncharacterized protein BABINDRAFT_40166 [Babjeviella inositovora NRRL Y-12698]ODQ78093.1 hypothetical protein BABINDRAFT_40166 [Babjeviella inositovora NRRL Y-12698]